MKKHYSKPTIRFLETQISERIAGTCFGTKNEKNDTLQARYGSGIPILITENGGSWNNCDIGSTMPNNLRNEIESIFGITINPALFGPNTTDNPAYPLLDFEPFNS